MATRKYIKNNAGVLTEESTVDASAGAGDSSKLVSLNTSGFLDSTIVNSTTSSAGAGDAGKVVALDGSGRIDETMMPVGIGADIVSLTASENLAAGDFVNVYDNIGTPNCRKADATTAGKEAHGFVLDAVTSGNPASVYFEGSNTSLSGLTAGPVYLSTTAGQSTATAPSAAGNVVQRIGVAVAATTINFETGQPVVLA